MRRETLPPLREDYFELGRHSHFVDVTEPEVRRVVVELLEAYGFKAEPPVPREDILRTFLPLTVNTETKVYSCAGNVTCAAAAATRRMVMDLEEFLTIYERDIKVQNIF